MIGYIFCIMTSFTVGFLMAAVLGNVDREDEEECPYSGRDLEDE